MLEAKEVQGALAIMPTPAKDGADSLEAVDTVDLNETGRRFAELRTKYAQPLA